MAETKTTLPVIEAFMTAHELPDVTIVADAGMVSETNQKAIEAKVSQLRDADVACRNAHSCGGRCAG
jgi:hypothetical protein